MIGLINGDAVERFCRDRADRMKQPMTAAIYAGLADRVSRGVFDADVLGRLQVVGTPKGLVVACTECGFVTSNPAISPTVAELVGDALVHVCEKGDGNVR